MKFNPKFSMDRRSFLAGTAAVTFASVGGAKVARAAGQIVVANWGGDWNDRTVTFFEAPIVEKAGYTVVRDLDGYDQRRTKILATRRLPRGTLDVSHMDDAGAFELGAQDALEEIDESMVPRLKDVLPQLKLKYFVPWQYSGWVIGYNPGKVKDVPKSWADLWNPKYKGMIGLSDAHWFHHMEVAALKIGKSLETVDIPALKASMAEMKKAVDPKIYPNHLQQAQALKNEEILIGTNYKARLLQFASEGANLQTSYPEEGAINQIFGFVLPKKQLNPEGAKFYVNALLDPEGLAGIIQKSFYSPANTKTVLTDDAKKKIAFTEDEQKRLHNRNHAFWLKNRAELLDWWNKEFKS